jgi:rRNA-processing protein FCF1
MAIDRYRGPEYLRTPRKGKFVILDTNFLFIPVHFGIDIFNELDVLLNNKVRCLIPKPVIDELIRLGVDAPPSLKKEIKLALEMSNKCEIIDTDLRKEENVDDMIVRLAVKYNYPVGTNDLELKKRLRGKGIPVVYLRQKAYLEIQGII